MKRLWVKAFLINVTFLALLLWAVFHFILDNQKKSLSTELKASILNSSQLFAQELSLSIFVWDKQSIEEKINILMSNSKSIIYCAVYSRKFDETLFFGPRAESLKKDPAVLAFLKRKPSASEENPFTFENKRYDHVIQPVIYKSNFLLSSSLPEEMVSLSPFEDSPAVPATGKTETAESMNAGDLHIGLSFESVEETVQKSREFFGYLASGVFLLSLVFYYLQTKLITRKLYYLTDIARNISAGRYDMEIKIRSSDEIGILAGSFKEMVERLLFSQAEIEKRNKDLDQALQRIQQFNQELEQKVSDRTEQLGTVNAALQEINKELKHANETKDRFLGMMSHELRTPLNAIIGFSQLAMKRVRDPAIQDFFYEIKNNGDHLLTLINDVLDYSKLEAGQFELLCEPFDLNKLIQEVAASSRALVENKMIEIKTTPSPEPQAVYGDRIRIKQVLLNLSSNACKFTQRGSVEFSCEPFTRGVSLPVAVPEKFHNRTMLVTVKDSGIGIPETSMALIFDRFKQLDTSETRIHGTGLGLSISKNLMELHHTTILVSSQENVGTAMYFFVPLSASDMEALALH